MQELAHLYHYYLHGEQGNRSGGSKAMREGRLPNGEPFPEIVLRYQVQQLRHRHQGPLVPVRSLLCGPGCVLRRGYQHGMLAG